jgi:hypothetical protein
MVVRLYWDERKNSIWAICGSNMRSSSDNHEVTVMKHSKRAGILAEVLEYINNDDWDRPGEFLRLW